MKNKKLTTLLVIAIITGLVFIYFPGCKKIDLERIAYVKTYPAENILSTSVSATGDIVDLGDGGQIKEYGFCLSYPHLPTIADKAEPPFENTSKVGKYYASISGLISNQSYRMRAYLVDLSGNVVYGNTIEFDTPVGIPSVSTENISNITETSATGGGNVTDNGGASVTARGVCWSPSPNPTLSNPNTTNGSGTGNFSSHLSGLNQNTPYYVRAYATDNYGTAYGNQVDFKTEEPGEWLHYDDGSNYNAIGWDEGVVENFDVAVRFPTQTLQQYNGFRVTRVKFFPHAESPVTYSITLWEGTNPPDLLHVQNVYSPVIDTWNEVTLTEQYVINSNMEFWVGYWVQNDPGGTYPAGVDNGPAITWAGDLISTDDGATWEALSEADPPNLDYNWNIQVFITNGKGEEVQLLNKIPIIKEKSISTSGNNVNNKVSAKKLSSKK